MSRQAFKHLTLTMRLKLEMRINAGYTVKEIAAELGVHPSTIYRELKRARYSYWTTEERYSPEKANQDAIYKNTAKGAPLKIGNNHAVVAFIEHLILEKRYSPAAVCAELRKPENFEKYHITFCRVTLYRYIDDGNIFPHITREDLRQGRRRKGAHKTVRPKRARRK